MQCTSHESMRVRRIVTEQGCVIPKQRMGRQTARLRAIAQSAGWR